jgi:hypothetical protein
MPTPYPDDDSEVVTRLLQVAIAALVLNILLKLYP